MRTDMVVNTTGFDTNEAFERGRQYERDIHKQNEKFQKEHEKRERTTRYLVFIVLGIIIAFSMFSHETSTIGLELDGSLYLQTSKYFGFKNNWYELRYNEEDAIWEYQLPNGQWRYLNVE